MNPISADSWEGRVLLALRAGAMTPFEINERWPSGSAPNYLKKLVSKHLVEKVGDEYRLTETGRTACPLRNPLAAAGIVQPTTVITETNMARDNIPTRQQVLAAITDAGPAGITKTQLVDKFLHLAAEPAITSHLFMLKKSGQALNPTRGLWVAAAFSGQTPVETIEIADVHPTTAAHFDALEQGDSAEAPPVGNACPQAPTAETACILVDNEDDIEIWLSSDGSMRIVSERVVVSLARPVTRKVRAFLGLFQEAA